MFDTIVNSENPDLMHARLIYQGAYMLLSGTLSYDFEPIPSDQKYNAIREANSIYLMALKMVKESRK